MVVAFAVGAVLAGVMVAHLALDIPTRDFTSDPTAVMEAPFYTGFVAVLGYTTWAAAAAVFLFAAATVVPVARDRTRALFLAIGLCSLLLYVDDAFLLHETVLPVYFGIPEFVTYAVYVAAALLGARYFARVVWEHPDGALLLASLGMLAGAILLDQVNLEWFTPARFGEAVLQLVGSSCWLAFAVRAGGRALRQPVATPPSRSTIHEPAASFERETLERQGEETVGASARRSRQHRPSFVDRSHH